MKKVVKLFMILIAVAAIRCTEEQVEPVLLEDQQTHADSYYPSSVFAIEVTTVSGNEEGEPQLTEFYLSGEAAKVSVNWGDGTIEKFTLDDSRNYMTHQYARLKNYTIQVTGEISKITTFGMYYQNIIIRNVYLAGLTNLTGISMGLNYKGPSVVNFSHNLNIQSIELGDEEITDIIIPSTNKLRTVLIDGPNSLSTAAVDRIISRVYTSVQASPRTGVFTLRAVWYEETDEMTGPPSSYSITKLKKLRDVYGWTIFPEMP